MLYLVLCVENVRGIVIEVLRMESRFRRLRRVCWRRFVVVINSLRENGFLELVGNDFRFRRLLIFFYFLKERV